MAGNPGFEAGQRVQAELGFGIASRRKAAPWVPFIVAEAADDGGQRLSTGVKFTSGPNIEMGLEFGRRENGQLGLPEHTMELGGTVRF